MGSLETYPYVILMHGLHLFSESQLLHIFIFYSVFYFIFSVFIFPRYSYSLLFHDYFFIFLLHDILFCIFLFPGHFIPY